MIKYWPCLFVLVICAMVFFLYSQGLVESKKIKAILYVFRPGKDADRVTIDSCTGWAKHAGRFCESRSYEFVFDGQLSSGDVDVILLDKKKPLLRLNLDYDEFEACEQIDFTGVSEWLDFFPDVCIEFTNTPCPSDGAKDVKKAVESVYQTPLFRQLVSQIQCALKTALIASPDQYGVLREEYQTHGILPDKYALELIQF